MARVDLTQSRKVYAAAYAEECLEAAAAACDFLGDPRGGELRGIASQMKRVAEDPDSHRSAIRPQHWPALMQETLDVAGTVERGAPLVARDLSVAITDWQRKNNERGISLAQTISWVRAIGEVVLAIL